MNKLYINSIKNTPSLCDGFGYRTVLFLQGCDLHCPGCQNPRTWDIKAGREVKIKDLAIELRKKAKNKKITISGGEPLMQLDGLLALLEELKDCDLCLYTGHELEEVPQEVLKYLKYIKVGPFKLHERTTIKPFVGSKNQRFIKVDKHE